MGRTTGWRSSPDFRREVTRRTTSGEVQAERRLLARLPEGGDWADGREAQHPRGKEVLTAREREILRLVASGSTDKETAQALSISEKTVRSHLNSIFKKLQVTRRVQATLYAIRRTRPLA